MKVLDCESIDITYTSLENILEIKRSRLESLFDDLDLDSFYRENPHYPIWADDHLFSEVTKICDPTRPYDQTCWFHLTRTIEKNDFKDGILPLNRQIDSIWDFLYSLVEGKFSRRKWNEFRKNLLVGQSHDAFLYKMKTGDSMHWGPFAILVRDIAFRAEEVSNHDYLRAPEIVEDICNCFSDLLDFNLLDAFMRKTKPCIVKFIGPPRDDCLRAALFYLHNVRWNAGFSQDSNTCFNGQGSPIPANRILKIEFPNYP